MEQKTIWRRYLIIGINCLIIFTSWGCNKDIEYIKTVSYIYHNDSKTDLTMKVYNDSGVLIKSFEIPFNEEITTNTTTVQGAALFFFDSNVDNIGVSIVVEFKTMKCLYYTGNGLDKIFDITQYDNYNTDLLKQKKYSLKYSFKDSDLDQAENCE